MRRMELLALVLLLSLPAAGRSQQPAGGKSDATPANAPLEHRAAEQLLERKIVELARLKREVDALRQQLGRDQQILVQVQAVRVSLTKLQELGFEIQHSTEPLSSLFGIPVGEVSILETYCRLVVDSKRAANMVQDFRRKQALVILAEPSLITTNNRPAYFFSGGEIPSIKLSVKSGERLVAATPAERFGTQVDVLPTLVSDNKVRLNVRPRISERDDEIGSSIEGVKTPGRRVVELDTSIEMELGKTLVVGGMRQTCVEKRIDPSTKKPADAVIETATYFLVTPKLVAPKEIASEQRPASLPR